MFEQALKAIVACELGQQKGFVARLENVRREGHNWVGAGASVGDDMDYLMAKYGFAKR